ncbi:MAG: 30S ribosomal protein S4 [Butyricicoccaceae bacterium]
MAKNNQPILKRCKTLGISPAVLGVSKETKRQPKQGRRKQSEYAMQLNEKQKVKFIYGVLETPFRRYYEKAEKMEGKAGENLLQLLERRLDNVVFRLGFANTRREARQLTSHAHFTVNGQKVNIPSYLVKPGDVIAVSEKSRSSAKFKALIEENGSVSTPKWLEREKDSFEGKVIAMPARDDIDYEVAEHLIVELYSK